MSMIFVDVHTPGNGKTYEFEIEDTMTVETAKFSMVEKVMQTENDRISFDAQTMLNNLTTESILSNKATLSAAGVKSGHLLLLV